MTAFQGNGLQTSSAGRSNLLGWSRRVVWFVFAVFLLARRWWRATFTWHN